MVENVKFLSRIQLFAGLEKEELERIEPVAPVELTKKGTIIATPHAVEKRLYLVKSGKVRLYKLTEDGKELTMDILGTGNLFGEVGSFAMGTHQLYAVALEDSHICRIDRSHFQRILCERPQLAIRFIEIVSTRLQEVEELMAYMAYANVRKRLLFLLYKLSEKWKAASPGEEGEKSDGEWTVLDVELTHQELASMAGSTRETVTEILGQFIEEGILKKGRTRKPLTIRTDLLRAALFAENRGER